MDFHLYTRTCLIFPPRCDVSQQQPHHCQAPVTLLSGRLASVLSECSNHFVKYMCVFDRCSPKKPLKVNSVFRTAILVEFGYKTQVGID